MQKVRKIVESSDGADALLLLAARDSRSPQPSSSVKPMVILHDDEEDTSDSFESVKPKNLKKRKTPDFDDPEEPHSAGSTSPSRASKSISLTSQIMDVMEENKKLKMELADLKLKLTPTNILDSMCISREVQRLVALETQTLRREIEHLRAELGGRNQSGAEDKPPRAFSAPASPNRAPIVLPKADEAFPIPTTTTVGPRPVVPVSIPPMSSLGFVQYGGASAPTLKPVMQPMLLVDAVLRESNKLSSSDRQLITEFVLGNKSRWDASKGPVQSIVMNEETISVPGEEHCEQIVFEANLVTGAWTKIKRRGRLHRPNANLNQ